MATADRPFPLLMNLNFYLRLTLRPELANSGQCWVTTRAVQLYSALVSSNIGVTPDVTVLGTENPVVVGP